ncbi:MAG: recombination mediator RecR [Alphaproteobacteria bacterium]|nr:recombination mediator RecR [Alphaproteobacteria bacterium]|tara:strand:- start:702 stop:1295 length:594 start_codon:yes stop_codon:yes gene_type:complete
MSVSEIEHLISLLAKLPGLGPRSARRVALHLLKKPDQIMLPLAEVIQSTASTISNCDTCGNLDTIDPCRICADEKRDLQLICVVEEVADLWAIERTSAFRGQYHVLGGTLSAIDGINPNDLNIETLLERAEKPEMKEVILATGATVSGQTTAHYILERLERIDVKVSRLSHGVPVGGELDYLDDGTLTTAINSRRPF